MAIVAAVFAFIQVRHARLLRIEQAQPVVLVDFESSPVWQNAIELVIENSGKTIATNVRVEFDPPLESSKKQRGHEIENSILLKEGIPTLPPGRQVRALFDLTHERKESGLPMSYKARVTFSNSKGRGRQSLSYVLDLNYRFGLLTFQEKGMHQIAEELGHIRNSMRRWTTHTNGLKVHMVDEDARRFEDRWHMKNGGSPPMLNNPQPAGRPAPSRFDRLREPWWRRVYWSWRLDRAERGEISRLERQLSLQPSNKQALEQKLAVVRARRARRRGPA
ncbi:hypothetical protein [Aquipuribacter sp. MA13-6]|uniref:hypothetical protein n=1 Tax=unclassified Aquipuribacter TaxID=2635084 RepID=UPI003EED80C5